MSGWAASLFSTYLHVSSTSAGSKHHGIKEGKWWINHPPLSGHFSVLIGNILESDAAAFCYLSPNCPNKEDAVTFSAFLILSAAHLCGGMLCHSLQPHCGFAHNSLVPIYCHRLISKSLIWMTGIYCCLQASNAGINGCDHIPYLQTAETFVNPWDRLGRSWMHNKIIWGHGTMIRFLQPVCYCRLVLWLPGGKTNLKFYTTARCQSGHGKQCVNLRKTCILLRYLRSFPSKP